MRQPRNAERVQIGIIGCGFSGLMVLHHLVRKALQPLSIRVYDRSGRFGRGIAYSTQEPGHRLNVPAGRMSALAHRPDDLLRWLKRNQDSWRSLHPELQGLEVTAGTFLPRMVYGLYLSDILERTLELARRYRHEVELIPLKVENVDFTMAIKDESGEDWHADRVIVATGAPGPRQFPFEHFLANDYLLRDPWNQNEENRFWEHFNPQHWHAGTQLALLGTGLTSIDVLYSLKRRRFPGKITLISPSGRLPKPHKVGAVRPQPADVLEYPRTALGIFQKIDREIEQLITDGQDWRHAIDRVRPVSNKVWQRMPTREQRRFLRHYLSWWSVLRHRMPPESYAMIEELRSAEKLTVLPGRLLHIGRDAAATLLYVQQRPNEKPNPLRVDAVINCSGYTHDLSRSGNALLLSLRSQELVSFSPLEMGIPVDASYRATGKSRGRLYAVGPLLFGQRLESTAVPELRLQAEESARAVLADLYESSSARATTGVGTQSPPWKFWSSELASQFRNEEA